MTRAPFFVFLFVNLMNDDQPWPIKIETRPKILVLHNEKGNREATAIIRSRNLREMKNDTIPSKMKNRNEAEDTDPIEQNSNRHSPPILRLRYYLCKMKSFQPSNTGKKSTEMKESKRSLWSCKTWNYPWRTVTASTPWRANPPSVLVCSHIDIICSNRPDSGNCRIVAVWCALVGYGLVQLICS